MRLSPTKIEAARQECEYRLAARREVWPRVSRPAADQRGFTLIELIMVLIITGILAVFVIPRFFDTNTFQSQGFTDQVQSSLRYAQKEAIAQRRSVCVRLGADNTIALFTPACGGAALDFPTGGNAIAAPNGVTFSSATPVDITFDALGRTAAQQTITVSGAANSIVVEKETGYVH